MSEETKVKEPEVVRETPPQRDVVSDLNEAKLEAFVQGVIERIVRNSPPEPDHEEEPEPLQPKPSPDFLGVIAAIPLYILVFRLSLYGAASMLYQMPIPYSYADSLAVIPAIVITGLSVGFIWLVTNIKLKQKRRTTLEVITGWVLLILAAIFAYYFFLYIYPVGWFYPENFTLAVALFLFICRKGYFYLFEALLSEAQPTQD